MNSKKLYAKTIPVKKLSPERKEVMWELFQNYYTDVDEARFLRDLEQKDHVILLFDGGSHIVRGFSTLQRSLGNQNGKPYVAVFTGDTIIDRQFWGGSALTLSFCNYLFRTLLSNPFRDVYWHLISKGYKTYLTMTRNTLYHWPRYESETPENMRILLDKLNTERFGNNWNAKTGIIRFSIPLGKLKENVAPIQEQDLLVPDIKFFNDINSNHQEGDELACLAKVDLATVVFCIRRIVRKSLKSVGNAIRRIWEPSF